MTDPTKIFDGRTCLACGNKALFIASGNYVTCSWLECPNPDTGDTICQAAEKRAAERVQEFAEQLKRRSVSIENRLIDQTLADYLGHEEVRDE